MSNWGSPLSEAAVDFSAARADGTLGVAEDFLRGLVPSQGDEIQLYDNEGNQCRAIVAEVHPQFFRVRLIWESWMPSPEELFVTGDTVANGATLQRTSPHTGSIVTLSPVQREDVDDPGVTTGLGVGVPA